MEFGGSLEEFIRQEVTVITGEKFSHACSLKGNLNGPEVKDLPTLLDMLGEGSAKAQRLPGPVTTHSKFKNTNHKIFLLSNIPSKRVLGFLKIGRKRLFVHDRKGVCVECVPLCVLDFYVHESHQRQGCGRKLFDFMLQSEDIKPSRLAIDLPSKKMIQFLHKHYHLINPIHLANNFVIYPGFFDNILYESVNTEKQSTIQSKLSPVEIQDLKKNVVNKNKMDPTLNTLYNKTNSHDNGPVCNKQTISSGKINHDSFITNIKPNSRQMHQLHTRIPEMPTNLMIIRPHDSSGRVWDVPIKTNEQNELNQQKAEMKGVVQDNFEEVKKCEVFTIVNSPKSQMRVKYSTLSNSQLCNYQPMMLQNPAKSSYSYISAVRNHNGHTRLW